MVRDTEVKFEHYFTEKPKSKLNLRKISTVLRGFGVQFFTGSGIFSPDKIDFGTALLTNNCIVKKGWSVLDLGCGYGAVGITIAKFCSDCKITLTDINERTVFLTKKNAKLNNVTVTVLHGNMYEPIKEQKFNTILLNPPQTAGKDLCNEMIKQGKQHLTNGGLFQLVARHNKGGKQFEKLMKEVYGNVTAIVKKGGFRVYISEL